MSDPITEQPEFRLDRVDLTSQTWSKLKKHLQATQHKLRVRLEEPNLDPMQTALLRGELRRIRNLLALDSPDPTMVADEEQGQ
jgi:aminoglycoside phosphotransferase (APT) family kinase protein